MKINTKTYDCPHCGTRVDVDEELVSGPVRCPNPACQRPFQPLPPAAPIVEPAEEMSDLAAGETLPKSIEEERVLRVVHPVMFRNHPFQYLFYVALIFGGVGAAVLSVVATPERVNADVLLALGVLAALFGAGALLGWGLRVQATTLTISNRRTVLRHGLIARQTTEVRHDDVRNLQVDQSIVQRILGIGNLAVSSAGQDDLEIQVRGIASPHGLAEMIRECQNASIATTQ